MLSKLDQIPVHMLWSTQIGFKETIAAFRLALTATFHRSIAWRASFFEAAVSNILVRQYPIERNVEYSLRSDCFLLNALITSLHGIFCCLCPALHRLLPSGTL